MKNIEYGPLVEQNMLTAGLDYYKPTMSQLAYEKERDTEVTFTFKNRGSQRLLDYIDPRVLQERLDLLQEQGFTSDEQKFLQGQTAANGNQFFSAPYLGYIGRNKLPAVMVEYDGVTDDIAINTTGEFPLVTFWETVVLGEVNEAYFESYVRAHDIDLFEVYDEGDRRLSEKIKILQDNPDIKFADFGTRRHFSLRWQKHVLDRLKEECPKNLLGTSNVGLANTLNLHPIGTFAHEMPMVYAGIADARDENIRDSHHKFLQDWFYYYGPDLSVALTDTFGTEFFFADFTPDQAKKWKGLRHDSGDPINFGEKVIEFYENLGIDPKDKTIVFSDGLDINQIVELHHHFEGRVNAVFGWGTSLTNDLGIEPLNIVMKATEVNGTPTVKLSDNQGKHTGPAEKIEEYYGTFTRIPATA